MGMMRRNARWRWFASCRRAARSRTPARGATPPPSTASLDAASYHQKSAAPSRRLLRRHFFDDRPAMPGIYAGSVAEGGSGRSLSGEARPLSPLGVIAGATRLRSTRRHHHDPLPFHVARTFATRPPHQRLLPGTWSPRSTTAKRTTALRRAHRPRRALRPGRRVPWRPRPACGTTWDDDASCSGPQAGCFCRPRRGPRARPSGEWYSRPRTAHRPRWPSAGLRSCQAQLGPGPRLRRPGLSSSSWATPTIDIAKAHCRPEGAHRRRGSQTRSP